ADFAERARHPGGDPIACVAREIRLAASPAGNPLLGAVLTAVGLPRALTGAERGTRSLPASAADVFVGHILASAGVGKARTSDTETLRLIAAAHGRNGGPAVVSGRDPVTVVLSGRPSDEGRVVWKALERQGDLAQTVTQAEFDAMSAQDRPSACVFLPSGFAVNRLLLVYLETMAGGDVSFNLRARTSRDATDWSQSIVGYPEQSDAAVVGTFVRGSGRHGTDLEIVPGEDGSDAARTGHVVLPVDAETAFAIVLRLDDAPMPAAYLNSANCVFVDGLAALRTRFADAPSALLQKPVVMVGRRSPVSADHIIESIHRFWSYGGRYPVAALSLAQDPETGRINVPEPQAEALVRMLPAAYTTLSLERALNLGPVQIDLLARGIFLPEGDGLCVQTASQAAISEISISGIERALNADGMDPATSETVFLMGQVDPSGLQTRNVIENWPIGHLLGRAVRVGRRLASHVADFDRAPSARLAAAILNMHERARGSAGFARDFDRFASKLATHPAVLLELEDGRIQKFLQAARFLPSVDAIGAALLPQASTLCRKSRLLILPLFELLACGQAPEDVQVALAFVAADPDRPPRALYRIADCIRRFGSAVLAVQYLALVQQTNPEVAEDSDFLRFFQKVLGPEVLPAARGIVGARIIQGIRDTIDPKDAFREATMLGDRDAQMGILADTGTLQRVDFLKWMDSLRALSNELCDAALPVRDAAPTNLNGLKLMGAIFADTEVLGDLKRHRFLDDTSDLSLICRNILGENGPLNAMLADRFGDADCPALSIEGQTAAQVFENAASTAAMPQARRTDGPLVSVILSAFEADIALLEISLASVLRQSHGNVEVFVVDDASSSDNSARLRHVVDSADGRVRYLRVETNSGPYVGRNLALAQATGAFVAIQDADDWSHPARFARQLAVFAAAPAIRLVTSPHIRIDRFGHVQMEAGFAILGDGPMTSMFRRDVFDEIGPFAAVRSRGDVEMRERIRSYYGPHALHEMALPMMLCFADSATLSQRTKAEKHEYLQLFRGNIDGRASLRFLRRAGTGIAPEHRVTVPVPLRPTRAG
ncbi:MAG: glycosyltransferase family A protein, partial [Jannaschia sp.]